MVILAWSYVKNWRENNYRATRTPLFPLPPSENKVCLWFVKPNSVLPVNTALLFYATYSQQSFPFSQLSATKVSVFAYFLITSLFFNLLSSKTFFVEFNIMPSGIRFFHFISSENKIRLTFSKVWKSSYIYVNPGLFNSNYLTKRKLSSFEALKKMYIFFSFFCVFIRNRLGIWWGCSMDRKLKENIHFIIKRVINHDPKSYNLHTSCFRIPSHTYYSVCQPPAGSLACVGLPPVV